MRETAATNGKSSATMQSRTARVEKVLSNVRDIFRSDAVPVRTLRIAIPEGRAAHCNRRETFRTEAVRNCAHRDRSMGAREKCCNGRDLFRTNADPNRTSPPRPRAPRQEGRITVARRYLLCSLQPWSQRMFGDDAKAFSRWHSLGRYLAAFGLLGNLFQRTFSSAWHTVHRLYFWSGQCLFTAWFDRPAAADERVAARSTQGDV
jgi:hypothetical protein